MFNQISSNSQVLSKQIKPKRPWWFWVILGAVALVIIFGGYTGINYAQASGLIREGDKLMQEERWGEALGKYEKAGKKFTITKKKVDAKISQARELKTGEDNVKLGEDNFGKGEWQKCLDYLGQVSDKHPHHKTAEERYSDCKKKLDEATTAAATAAAASTAQAATTATGSTGSSSGGKTNGRAGSSSSASSSSGSSNTSGASGSGSQTQARPVLSLPFTDNPPRISPMGETLFHPKPQNPTGHGGIDFIWLNTPGNVDIVASINATVTAIRANSSHSGAWDVLTRGTENPNYGVDYTELGGARSGLKVGDTLNVGDVLGYAYHPPEYSGEQANYKMIHWMFGTQSENPTQVFGLRTSMCPMSYFSASAAGTMNTIWANMDWPEIKANAPAICSGDYAG